MRNGIKFAFYFLGFFLLSLPLWVNKYFGHAEFDQLLFTIKFGIKGAITSDPVFIKRFLKWCIIYPLLLSALITFLSNYSRFNLLRFTKIQLHFMIFIIGAVFFSYQFNVVHFFRNYYQINSATDDFKFNYVDPATITFQTHHPKNLVLIYVEGLESTYSNKKIFQKDLLSRLNTAFQNGISFEKFKQVSGTGWTIAGLVATQCGIPLKSVTMFGTNRQGEVSSQFLPSAKCLGDILYDHGYSNVYMKGASLRFGGIRQFLKTHHYTERYGKEEWQAAGDNYDLSGWGLHDDQLFSQAKKRLNSLMESGKRFNLTLLTVDTHGSDGYLNNTCKAKNYRGFEGIVECTASEVNDFIAYIKQNHWEDKISVIIIGDHLAMHNPVYQQLESAPARYVFNLIITQPLMSKRTDEIVHFDMLPTILDTLGFQYEGGKLGLGYSGLAGSSHRLPLPENRIAKLENAIDHYSKTYNQLWTS